MATVKVRNKKTGEIGYYTPGIGFSTQPPPQSSTLPPIGGKTIGGGILGGIGGAFIGQPEIGAALGAGIGRAMETPGDTPMEVAKTAATTGLTSALFNAPFRVAGKFFGRPYLTAGQRSGFAEKTAGAFKEASKGIGERFGEELATFKNPVNFQPMIEKLTEHIKQSPSIVRQLSTSFEKVGLNPTLIDDLITDSSLAKDLTPQDANLIRRAVNQTTSLQRFFGGRGGNAIAGRLGNVARSMKDAMIATNKGMKPLLEESSKLYEAADIISPFTEPQGAEHILTGSRFMRSGVTRKAGETVMQEVPGGGKTFSDIVRAGRTAGVQRFVTNPFHLGLGFGGYALRKVLSGK